MRSVPADAGRWLLHLKGDAAWLAKYWAVLQGYGEAFQCQDESFIAIVGRAAARQALAPISVLVHSSCVVGSSFSSSVPR